MAPVKFAQTLILKSESSSISYMLQKIETSLHSLNLECMT